ncbi:MAG: 4Fe-4S dicluster domain-containing protein [bacterium]
MTARIFTGIEDKLGLDKFKAFHKAHLTLEKKDVDQKKLVEEKLFICPAKVYTLNDKNEMVISFENCLECGTCRVVCPEEIGWEYPMGGHGVTYRFG